MIPRSFFLAADKEERVTPPGRVAIDGAKAAAGATTSKANKTDWQNFILSVAQEMASSLKSKVSRVGVYTSLSLPPKKKILCDGRIGCGVP